MYFVKGPLIWRAPPRSCEGTPFTRVTRETLIKAKTSIEDLCKGYPPEFATYLNYCRNLRFEETPDYRYLRQIFRGLFESLGHKYDSAFDWTMPKGKAPTSLVELTPTQVSPSEVTVAMATLELAPTSVEELTPTQVSPSEVTVAMATLELAPTSVEELTPTQASSVSF
jgi:hypothetical protein